MFLLCILGSYGSAAAISGGAKEKKQGIQKKWKEKIYHEPELNEEYLRKEEQRWKKRIEDRKIKNISDLNEREKRSKRKVYKGRHQESREYERKGPEHPQTSPDSPLEQTTGASSQ